MALLPWLRQPAGSSLPFMKGRHVAFVVTLLIAAISVISLSVQGLNLGLDFTGGVLVEARSPAIANIQDVRRALADAGFADASVQLADGGTVVLVRVPPAHASEADRLSDTVREAVGAGATIAKVDAVGPAVSGELLQKGLIATGLAIVMISVYVWFRFELKFGLAALITTFHDVFATIGLFSVTQMNFDLAIVAAVLTVAGYSINDTVVIYDRIRENLRRHKSMPLPEMIDRSISETLRRTTTTAGTTLMTSLALLIFGGPVLFGFAAAISFGILIGTYSSIFVAAPLLIYLPGKLPGRETEAVSSVGEQTPSAPARSRGD